MFDELYIFYWITLSKMYGLLCCSAVCTGAAGGWWCRVVLFGWFMTSGSEMLPGLVPVPAQRRGKLKSAHI